MNGNNRFSLGAPSTSSDELIVPFLIPIRLELWFYNSACVMQLFCSFFFMDRRVQRVGVNSNTCLRVKRKLFNNRAFVHAIYPL